MARTAVIGKGWGSRVQGPLFREAGHDVVALAGRDDWRSAIDSDADLVIITMPPSQHLLMATAALAAGKHVVSEKPTAMNAAEAEQLLDAARAHPDRITLIDHELRFVPAFQAARERVRELGGIRYIEARYASPARGDRNRAWNWWSDADEGGGVWGAIGSHLVDCVRFLAGEIEAAQATMTAIIADRPHGDERRTVTADDFAAVNLRLANGALAVLSMSAVSTGPDEATAITIHGESGALRLIGEELLSATRGGEWSRAAGNEMAKLPGNSLGGAFGTGTLLLAQALKRAIDEGDRSGLAVAATFEDGLAQQRVLDAARRSARNGGVWTDVGGVPFVHPQT